MPFNADFIPRGSPLRSGKNDFSLSRTPTNESLSFPIPFSKNPKRVSPKLLLIDAGFFASTLGAASSAPSCGISAGRIFAFAPVAESNAFTALNTGKAPKVNRFSAVSDAPNHQASLLFGIIHSSSPPSPTRTS